MNDDIKVRIEFYGEDGKVIKVAHLSNSAYKQMTDPYIPHRTTEIKWRRLSIKERLCRHISEMESSASFKVFVYNVKQQKFIEN